MANKVLLIGLKDDTHIPYVSKHLSVPIQVIDPSECSKGTELSYTYRGGKFRIIFDGKEIKDVQSVWYRKPRPIWGDALPVPPKYRHYSETAILAHVRELYTHFSNVPWVSDYYAIRRADHKGLQQEEASRLGFRIPDTIATSDGDAAKAFVDDYPETIVKSLASTFPLTDAGEPTMFYSKKIRRGQKFDYAGLQLAPAIFQQAIDHQLDLRITVVGKQAFAISIKGTEVDESLELRDWRPAYFYGKLDMKPFELPKDIEEKCIALVANLGLKYGAIDLILDKKGNYWFLENNPNGEWAFVEYATGHPIGKAIASALMGDA